MLVITSSLTNHKKSTCKKKKNNNKHKQKSLKFKGNSKKNLKKKFCNPIFDAFCKNFESPINSIKLIKIN